MKIRNGFVSNSSSSSFVIKDIQSFDCMSSYAGNHNSSMKKKNPSRYYTLARSGGHHYKIKDIVKFIEQHGYSCKVCDSIKDIDDYDCAIVDISKETDESIKEKLGRYFRGDCGDIIWNPCKLLDSDCWSMYSNDTSPYDKKPEYFENPIFKMALNSPEFEEYKKKVEENKSILDAWSKDRSKPEPDWDYVRLDLKKYACKWCRDHGGNVCFPWDRALDEGDILITTGENCFDYEFMEKLEKKFNCILYVEHDG